MKKILSLFILVMLVFSCNLESKNEKSSSKIKVTTTLNYYANLVEEIAKDKVEIESLMKEGEDPHLYVASAGDISKLENANLVIFGGLHLEGKMIEIFENLKNKEVLDLSSVVDKSKLLEEEAGIYDPHVWFDTEIWASQAKAVKEKLELLDPANKDFYNENLEKYLKDLEELTKYTHNRISEIKEESRYLVTAHDAFAYFARQFGIEVKAIQGISTDSEIGTKEIDDLANFIIEHKIKAIFVETSVNSKSIESLKEAVKAKGGEVEIGGELYSDSMGDKEKGTETYIKTFKFNVDTFVDALK